MGIRSSTVRVLTVTDKCHAPCLRHRAHRHRRVYLYPFCIRLYQHTGHASPETSIQLPVRRLNSTVTSPGPDFASRLGFGGSHPRSPHGCQVANGSACRPGAASFTPQAPHACTKCHFFMGDMEIAQGPRPLGDCHNRLDLLDFHNHKKFAVSSPPPTNWSAVQRDPAGYLREVMDVAVGALGRTAQRPPRLLLEHARAEVGRVVAREGAAHCRRARDEGPRRRPRVVRVRPRAADSQHDVRVLRIA